MDMEHQLPAVTATVQYRAVAAAGQVQLPGHTIEVAEFLRTIERVSAALGLSDFCRLEIADDAVPNLFVSDLDDTRIDAAIPGLPRTEIARGIEKSLRQFLEHHERSAS